MPGDSARSYEKSSEHKLGFKSLLNPPLNPYSTPLTQPLGTCRSFWKIPRATRGGGTARRHWTKEVLQRSDALHRAQGRTCTQLCFDVAAVGFIVAHDLAQILWQEIAFFLMGARWHGTVAATSFLELLLDAVRARLLPLALAAEFLPQVFDSCNSYKLLLLL